MTWPNTTPPAAYGRHPLLRRPDPDTVIWRYVDLARLIDLLETGNLHFAQAASMFDPWEGALTPEMEAADVEDLNEMIRDTQEKFEAMNPSAGFQLIDPAADIAADYRSRWVEARQWTYLSCWAMAPEESAAMWDLYGGQGGGVAIQSTFARLEASLPTRGAMLSAPRVGVDDPRLPIYASVVNYIDYRIERIPGGNTLLRFAFKRRSFEHERELRLLIDAPGLQPMTGLYVPTDLGQLIARVHVAPLAQPWFADVVRRTVSRHLPGVETVRSDLYRDPIA